jgi:hypothetical protein
MLDSTFEHAQDEWSRLSFLRVASLFKQAKVYIPFCLPTVALQIATAGKLRAVPHLVRGSNVKGIARNTLAVFIQNDLEDTLGVSKETFAQFASRTLEKNLAS